MSLLLDALKRAEQAKLAKQAQEPTGETAPNELVHSELSIAPVDIPAQTHAPPVAPAPLAQQGSELSLQESELVQSSPARAEDEQTRREAAKNVFAAKQAASPDRRPWILPVVAVALISAGAGGWYVWNEISKYSKPMLQARTVPSAGSVMPALQPTPIVQAPRDPLPPARPDTGQLATTTPAQPALPAPIPPVTIPRAKSNVELADSASSLTPAVPRPSRESFIQSLKEPVPAKDSPLALKLAQAIEPPRVSAELASAYAALKAGDYTNARKLYAAVLKDDSLSLDAHLGMATVLARSGDGSGAANAYRKALEIDPRNSTALAGLIALSNSSNWGALEVDLRTLLVNNPNSAALSFSLGNLYASQSRWTEAQQVYFEAFRIDPENADYLYNLAVSLDQLKQPRIASDYYQRALVAAGKGGAQFDPSQVTRRVNELKSAY